MTFNFNVKYYKEITGVALGSPLATALSELFLRHIEKEKLEPMKEKLGIIRYFRYVDDIFLCVRSHIYSKEFLLSLIIYIMP